MNIAPELSIADVARERKVSQRTARRWLKALDKGTGKVLQRRGAGKNAKFFTTWAAIKRVDRTAVESELTPEERVAILERDARRARTREINLRKYVTELGKLVAGMVDRETAAKAVVVELGKRIMRLEKVAHP